MQEQLFSDLQNYAVPLTFERLVQKTADRLAAQRIPAEAVRDVLQDAGIDECLRHTNPEPQGRLIVHQIHVLGLKRRSDTGSNGHFEYKRRLGTGLWGWVGQNGTGKSTLLNCIVWALTGADSGISRRVRAWIDTVCLWFSVGEAEYTSRIERSDDMISGGLYRGFHTPDEIDLGRADAVTQFKSRDEMKEALDLFFMQNLGISTLRWTAHGSQKDDPDLHAHSTTWRTYAHAIHIEDDSYDDLIIDPQKGYGRQDRKILEMMLGVDHARAVAEIQVEADFAREAYGRARSRISGKQADIAGHIAQLEQDLAEVQQAIDLMQSDQPTIIEDDRELVARREQRAALLAEQNRLDAEIAGLQAQVNDAEQQILDIEREKVALQEQSEVEYLINSLAVVRCPHCESAVDDSNRLARERADHTCHVCSQPIQRTRTSGDLRNILKERDDEISELRKRIKRAQDEIGAQQQKLGASREVAAQLGKALETSVDQARQGFTQSMANLLVSKGQIEGQIAQLKRSQAEVADEQMEVETAARWHTILQTAAEVADEDVYAMYQHAFGELQHLTARLAAEFGVPDVEGVVIDEKRYVKLVQGGMTMSHNDLARSERVKFKVAFHLALMLIQVRAGLGKHPGFMIIDTPGTAEIDVEDLVAMTRDLTRLHMLYGDKVQILLATARPEVIPSLPAGLIETPQVDGRFF